jgi:hypothetical protein
MASFGHSNEHSDSIRKKHETYGTSGRVIASKEMRFFIRMSIKDAVETVEVIRHIGKLL